MKLSVFDQMEMGVNKWEANSAVSDVSIRGILGMLKGLCDSDDRRAVIQLGHGDPSVFPCFRTSQIAEDAVVDAIRSGKFNSYAPSFGFPPARRAVAEFLSRDLPYTMSSDDIFLTVGCIQAIEIVVSALARPRANILLPRPGFPLYESHAALNGIEIRHFDLLPNKSWEVDLESVESLADENTVAIVIINPGNPCGTVFSYQHLLKIAETAKKLGICVVSDEVYGHIAFGNKPFVPMGVFGSIVPVVTLGSLSKRWIVPGWRIGWIGMNDRGGVLKQTKFVDKIKGIISVSSDPPTFVQAAIPKILAKTSKDFFNKFASILRQCSDICFNQLREIKCLSCPNKPDGSMFMMVQLHVSKLEDVIDDLDFCIKLAKEESVIVLPGFVLGLKGWLRITFAVDPSSLEEGMQRIKAFCNRHAKLH